MLTRTIDGAALEANKALVRAHYDAVINAFDADAIHAQVLDDFYVHWYADHLQRHGFLVRARQAV